MTNLSEKTVELGKERLSSIAANAYSLAWQYFPVEIRPDQARLPNKDNIVIGEIADDPRQLHPKMKEFYKKQNKLILATMNITVRQENVTWFDGNSYTFHPELLNIEENSLKYAVYSEVGTMVQMQAPFIQPAEYTEEMRKDVQEALDGVLIPAHGVSLEDTHVRRGGFQRQLRVGDYFVAELRTMPHIPLLNSMFVFGFASVSEEIMKLGGNTSAFDEAVKSGRMTASGVNLNAPLFYDAFFTVAQYTDWRIILKALHAGDMEEVFFQLQPHVLNDAKDVIRLFLDSLFRDQQYAQFDVGTQFNLRNGQ